MNFIRYNYFFLRNYFLLALSSSRHSHGEKVLNHVDLVILFLEVLFLK